MTASVTAIVESMATAWNAGDMQRVLVLAAQVPDAEAGNEAFLALLGMAQQQTGEYPRAAQTFERLTRIRPDIPAELRLPITWPSGASRATVDRALEIAGLV